MDAKRKKNLDLIHVFCIAAGPMISSGIFVLPGQAHAKAGPAVIVSYFLAGLLACVGLLNGAELTTAMPRAGGDYVFITRSMGPAVGTVAGILTWFSLSLKSAFALVGMAAFVRVVTVPTMPDIVMQGIAVGLALVLVLINLAGSREVACLQVALVIVLLSLMALYVVLGLPAVRPENLDPVAPKGLPAVLYTAGFVFLAYGGLLKVCSVAEEVRHPGRIVPLVLHFINSSTM
jgi:amino acid transporter